MQGPKLFICAHHNGRLPFLSAFTSTNPHRLHRFRYALSNGGLHVLKFFSITKKLIVHFSPHAICRYAFQNNLVPSSIRGQPKLSGGKVACAGWGSFPALNDLIFNLDNSRSQTSGNLPPQVEPVPKNLVFGLIIPEILISRRPCSGSWLNNRFDSCRNVNSPDHVVLAFQTHPPRDHPHGSVHR